VKDSWRGDLAVRDMAEIETHVQGLRHSICGRGGFAAMCHTSPLSWILAYTDLRTYGELSAGWTAISAHDCSSSAPRPSGFECGSGFSRGPYSCTFRQLAEEYTSILRDFCHEVVKGIQSRSFSTADGSGDYGQMSQLFHSGTPVHRLLTDLNFVVNCPRIVALFLSHAVLWDRRHDSRFEMEGYFKSICTRMVEEGLDIGGSIDQFVWILITAPKSRQIDCIERTFLLARLLRVHGRLLGHL
jgi:hypothetical protein